ncbi:ciliogenesis and planar polarity effector 2 isoform X4 [Serinus canaria]|uniref:ciliogenesis and planar polarity effector 2 isoform X4 n=1 Tax=Serinus canaria TaxID=9135 RepID=UPI0021CC7ABF|nr:ciliogenesis and planar polarity effector 2 isoform X4 [Serinus canaria]
MEGGQAPHRGVSGTPWVVLGRMLGHGGCFSDPMKDLGALGRVPGPWSGVRRRPQSCRCGDPMGEWGLFTVGLGAYGRAGLGAGAGLAPVPRRPPLPGLHPAQEPAESVRSGVGKTALVAWLGGTPAPAAHHETLGIEATTLFWPAKPRGSGRPVLFQLHLWDCGDGALRKFEHLLPGCPRAQACKEEADAALFLFSFTDRASFEELPALMGRVLGPGDRHLVRVVVGTKYPFGGPQRSPRGGGIAPPGLSALGIAGAENGTTMDSLLLLIFTEFWGFFRCSFTPPPAVPEWVRTRRFLSIWYLSRLRMCTNGYTNGFTVPAYF